MSAKQRGLGKGLNALIGQRKPEQDGPKKLAPEVTQGEQILMISTQNIAPNPNQARKVFEETALQELADSITASGILQPLVATRASAGKFTLIAGERRLRAATIAGLEKVPVRIVEAPDPESAAILGLVENLQREDLDAIEEAEAYKLLCGHFQMKQEQVAKAVAKSRPYVANAMRLLELPGQILNLIRSGALSAGHGRAILRLPDRGDRITLAKHLVAHNLSVRDAEALAEKWLTEKKNKGNGSGSKPHPHGWLADELRSRFGTKVELMGGADKGKIVIHYYTEQDLTRIMELIK